MAHYRLEITPGGETFAAAAARLKISDYKHGEGFYQVQKKESVSAEKILVLWDGKTFSDGREKLGLSGKVDVKPAQIPKGCMLFVNSTSPNRKLQPGHILFSQPVQVKPLSTSKASKRQREKEIEVVEEDDEDEAEVKLKRASGQQSRSAAGSNCKRGRAHAKDELEEKEEEEPAEGTKAESKSDDESADDNYDSKQLTTRSKLSGVTGTDIVAPAALVDLVDSMVKQMGGKVQAMWAADVLPLRTLVASTSLFSLDVQSTLKKNKLRPMLEVIATSASLTDLDLEGCDLTGADLSPLAKCTALTSFGCGPDVTRNSLKVLLELLRLRSLNLCDGGDCGPEDCDAYDAFTQLGRNTSLTSISLQSCMAGDLTEFALHNTSLTSLLMSVTDLAQFEIGESRCRPPRTLGKWVRHLDYSGVSAAAADRIQVSYVTRLQRSRRFLRAVAMLSISLHKYRYKEVHFWERLPGDLQRLCLRYLCDGVDLGMYQETAYEFAQWLMDKERERYNQISWPRLLTEHVRVVEHPKGKERFSVNACSVNHEDNVSEESDDEDEDEEDEGDAEEGKARKPRSPVLHWKDLTIGKCMYCNTFQSKVEFLVCPKCQSRVPEET